MNALLARPGMALAGTVALLAGVVVIARALAGGWTGALALLAIYFVVWWTVLFAVLPFGIRSQAEADAVIAGTERAAPVTPGLAVKSFWTTLVALGVFLAFQYAYRTGAFERFIDGLF